MPKGNSLDSWIDPQRIEELLEVLRPGSCEREQAPEEITEDPVTGESTSEPPNAERLLADEIPERAFAKGLPPKPEKAPAMETTSVAEPAPEAAPDPIPMPPGKPAINPLGLYFHSPASSPEARARAFVTWVRKTADATAAYVVDAYGACIAADPSADPVFLASISHLADALGRGKAHVSRPDQGALHLELADDQTLCLMQAKWDVATVALGVICDAPLAREVAVRYREELAKLAQKPRRRPRD